MIGHMPPIDARRIAAWLPDPAVAFAGGLGTGLWIPTAQLGPLILVGLLLPPFLAGRAVASKRLAVLAILAAVGPPLLATLTFDLWCREQGSAASWFGFGLILWVGILAVVTPVGFLLGHHVASDVDDPQPVARIIVAIAAVVAAVSWSVALATNATNAVCSS